MPAMLRVLATVVAAALVGQASRPASLDLAALERDRVLTAAAVYMKEAPRTITASRSPRSAGGPHDFFSEGDYWWPDAANPGGPYIQRDGMTNPDNFVEHRRALMRFSVQMPALVAAWSLTRDDSYAAHAARHVRAWFLDEATRMNPSLLYAQAIHGRTTGRGIGIIDTIHLVEVARALEVLEPSGALNASEYARARQWFTDYVTWMTTHPNGVEERDAKNNHGTCWAMQVAAFAHFTGDAAQLRAMRERFRTVLAPGQIAADGSFPLELKRTKPYGYSLFNLDAFTTLAQLLSTSDDNLWTFETPDGRGLRKAVAWMAPFIRDKKTWPLAPDVMHDAEWPMRHSSLLFAGLAYGDERYLSLWRTLRADSDVEEVVRNFFIRQPLLWVR